MKLGEAASHSIRLVAMMPLQVVSNQRAQSLAERRGGGGDATILTIWKKSLLFNCSGFTVFDGKVAGGVGERDGTRIKLIFFKE